METDSLATVHLLRDEKLNLEIMNLSNIIFDCKSVFRTLRGEANHVFQEVNFRADTLASLSISQHCIVVFHSIPNCLKQHLYKDSMGDVIP